jgi:tRNA-splicing ligase RtcB
MYNVIKHDNCRPIKHWTKFVSFEDGAKQQLQELSTMSFLGNHIAVMPDVHLGCGSSVGTVIPTINAIIPAAVGVDIGCGMMAVKTSLSASDLPENLFTIRSAIEQYVPHGRTSNGKSGSDKGAWKTIPKSINFRWCLDLKEGFDQLTEKHSRLKQSNNISHLGSLGGGNHFIEICLDEHDAVWIMLHSGSRGVGNAIGQYYINLAQKEMERWFIQLPNKDLAYLPEGSQYFGDYVRAVSWAQKFAMINREIMMENTIAAISNVLGINFAINIEAVNCHHNYISKEIHFGKDMWITRKGAVRAGYGEMGIIPGSMGAKSFIVRGLGNTDSFCSCSHGAGRVMSRTKAKELVTVKEHEHDLNGIECNKSADTLDETPKAYKDIVDVMASQSDLVEIVHTLKQVLCVKG